ncbi:MAG TPA: UDP-N-acetylmuramoyl-tripeptide--D-alanyl-D-alanine ligase [Vicinamibacteria bacterium]|nr:UDP-N-acetylmuramoyl-tripeptide--D-alanyl-D-alanine ligase [Vicinamibacteria bacterium]
MKGASVTALENTLTMEEIAQATHGRVAGGGPAASVAGVSKDSRTLAKGHLFVAVKGPNFDGHDFVGAAVERGAAAAMVHRDMTVPPGYPLVRVGETTQALKDLGRHVRMKAGLPVVAVTGSAGKTTTKEMTAALLGTQGPVLKTEGNLNNQYGLPLTLLRLAPEHRFAVLELGMSAAGELRELTKVARPDVAIITMVAPVHLEFFDSVDAIAAAKAEILEGLDANGVAVLNREDPRVRRIGEQRKGRTLWFGRDRACDISAENWRGTIHGMRFDMRVDGRSYDVALPLPGPHFLLNFLAATAAAHHLGVPLDTIVEAATHLKAAKSRGQVRRLGEGVTLLDDSYNSNPAAVDAAVTALDMAAQGRRVVFLGDMLELGKTGPELHRETGAKLAGRADVVVGGGALGREFAEGARSAGVAASALRDYADSAAAAAEAAAIVKPGDAVLVKGSRGARMEKVVEALVARFGEKES